MVAVWADPSLPVTRRVYVMHGLVLAAVKYLGDVALVAAASGAFWTPLDYLHRLPSLLVRAQFEDSSVWALAPALALWMLPFMLIGVMLSARRAIDAGWSPWWTTFFLVPFANYALMAGLTLL